MNFDGAAAAKECEVVFAGRPQNSACLLKPDLRGGTPVQRRQYVAAADAGPSSDAVPLNVVHEDACQALAVSEQFQTAHVRLEGVVHRGGRLKKKSLPRKIDGHPESPEDRSSEQPVVL